MIYVTSDLHGYPLEKFLALLERAGFSEADYLFVLGDVIDRGSDGVRLLRWMAAQPNVELILGNHEAMLLGCGFVFDEVTEDNLEKLDMEKMLTLQSWLRNGAHPTLSGMRSLLKREPEALEGILDYLRDAPLWDIVEAGGRTYILVHSGPDNFHPARRMDSYTAQELLWSRPSLDTRYFTGATVVFGHTPTEYFGEEFRGRAVKTDTWICIDTGAAGGGSPMLLRLDDLQEFY